MFSLLLFPRDLTWEGEQVREFLTFPTPLTSFLARLVGDRAHLFGCVFDQCALVEGAGFLWRCQVTAGKHHLL